MAIVINELMLYYLLFFDLRNDAPLISLKSAQLVILEGKGSGSIEMIHDQIIMERAFVQMPF